MKSVYRLLASYGLSMIVLGAMFVVVLLGTYDQVDNGIYQAQLKYFDSWYFDLVESDGLFVPFPGGMLLMSALAANLVVGGLVNLKRSWSRAGILVCHLGIVVLMAAGLVKFALAEEGGVQLYEGESSAMFVSYHEREIVVTRNLPEGGCQEWSFDDATLVSLDAEGKRSTTLSHQDIPFALRLDHLLPNARIERQGLRPADQVPTPVVGGYYAMPRMTDKVAERNAMACYVALQVDGQTEQRGILSELSSYPWSVEIDGALWGVKLRRRQHQLPFTVRLTDFERKVHPTSGRPLAFQSDVQVLDQGGEKELQKFRISMNKPLRRDGYVLFQSSWGPADAAAGERLFSIFSVVNNPADQWPLFACIITTLGMMMHFGRKLYRYVRGQVRGNRGGAA